MKTKTPSSQLNLFDFENHCVEPLKSFSRRTVNREINKILWAINGSIIVMPGYTDMTIPEDIRNRITLERLILTAQGIEMASEPETMLNQKK